MAAARRILRFNPPEQLDSGKEAPLITVLSRFEMLEGKEIDMVEAIRKMIAAVKANEPGCIVYTVSRGQVNGSELYFFEIYEDNQAHEAHHKTEHMRTLQRAMDDYIDNSSFNVESLNQLGGFVRHEMEHIA